MKLTCTLYKQPLIYITLYVFRPAWAVMDTQRAITANGIILLMGTKLNIVDKDGAILGEEFRDVIHRDGLLHREVHVWLYTPNKELIFQHRAKDKDTFPDLLDATVGGHVEIGDDWVTTALKELQEETGVHTEEDNLVFIDEIHSKTHDTITGLINNTLRRVYALEYNEGVENLVVEEGESFGFEAWDLDKLTELSSDERKRFIPQIFDELNMPIIFKIKRLAESARN